MVTIRTPVTVYLDDEPTVIVPAKDILEILRCWRDREGGRMKTTSLLQIIEKLNNYIAWLEGELDDAECEIAYPLNSNDPASLRWERLLVLRGEKATPFDRRK